MRQLPHNPAEKSPKSHITRPTKKILGIDPGFAITGFGLIEIYENQQLELKDFGVITTSKETPFPDRLTIIRKDLETILDTTNPDATCIEKLFFAKNTTTAMNVAHARGMIIERIAARQIPIIEYTPLEIKQTVTGFGRATKEQVLKMVQLSLKLKIAPTPDDAVDAIACALCYASRMKFDILSTEKSFT